MRRDWQSFFAHSDCFPPGRSSDFGGSLPADLQNTFGEARPNSVRPAKIPSTESASDYPLTVARLTSPRFYHDYRQCQHLITRLPQFRSSHNPYRRIRVRNFRYRRWRVSVRQPAGGTKSSGRSQRTQGVDHEQRDRRTHSFAASAVLCGEARGAATERS